MIGNNATILSLGCFVEFDGIIRDRGGLELLATRCFTLRVVWPTLSKPACAASAMA
jgi:hypothetical protein